MFWDKFVELCVKKDMSPARVCAELKLSNATATHWKQRGSMPQSATLKKIADYFGVDAEYFRGKSDEDYKNDLKKRLNDIFDSMTEEEQKKALDIIEAFRK